MEHYKIKNIKFMLSNPQDKARLEFLEGQSFSLYVKSKIDEDIHRKESGVDSEIVSLQAQIRGLRQEIDDIKRSVVAPMKDNICEQSEQSNIDVDCFFEDF